MTPHDLSTQVTARQWQGLKQRPTQFGSFKNTPGKDGTGTPVERSADYFKAGTHAPVSMKTKSVTPDSVDEPATTPAEPGKGDFEEDTYSQADEDMRLLVNDSSVNESE